MDDQVKIDPRITSVESQIAACMRGATNVITCPYCNAQNRKENESLCCNDMGLVVRAVLRKQAQRDCIEIGMRIGEQMARIN